QRAAGGTAPRRLDATDLSHPVKAGRLILDGDALPHWISHEPDGNRLVITGFGSLATHALFATIDLKSGALALKPRKIDFDRKGPDGWNGPAMPHGAFLGNAAAATR